MPLEQPWVFQTRALGSFLLRLTSAHGHDIMPLSTLLLPTKEWQIAHGNTIDSYKRLSLGDISKLSSIPPLE